MSKKLAIYASYLAASTLAATPAFAAEVVSSVRAEVKDSLNAGPVKATKRIDYPEPGMLNVGAQVFCGDGDVAHYASAHPNWKNTNANQVPFTLGYWIAPESDPIPKEKNYMSMGTGMVSTQGGYVKTFTPYYGNASKEMLAFAKGEMSTLVDARPYRMSASVADADKYRLYVGVMTCTEVVNPDSRPLAAATVLRAMSDLRMELNNSSSNFMAASQPSSTDWDKFRDKLGVKLSTSDHKLNYSLGNGEKLSGDLAELAKKVFDLSYPADGNIEAALNGVSFKGQLSSLANAVDSKTKCGEVGNGISSTEQYKWELFPMQLTCSALNAGSPGTFSAAVSAYLGQTTGSESQFKAKRATVVALLAAASQMQSLSAYWEDKMDPYPAQRCFLNAPGKMIDYTINSAVLQLKNPAVPDVSYGSSHPEPSYAIGQFAMYDGHDEMTIFGQTGADPSYGWNFTRGSAMSTVGGDFLPKSVRVNLNIRGIGCSNGPMYCYNDR